MSGRGSGRAVVVGLVIGLMGSMLMAGPALGQSSPDGVLPTDQVRSVDVAQDADFQLTIETDTARVASDGPPIQIDTTLSYNGSTPSLTVSTMRGGMVAFGVRQLDGPFWPKGPFRRASRGEETWTRGDVRGIPFAKSGTFSASDPLADTYRAWFADPMLRLPPGTFEITAEALYGPGDGPQERILAASLVIEVTDGGADVPFVWPLVPRPVDDPVLPAFRPTGAPDAAITRDGLRLELWLSTRVAQPGSWVQAVVRTTNVGRDALWQYAGPCAETGPHLEIDLRSVTPLGERQTGRAATFKRRALRDGADRVATFMRLPVSRRVAPDAAGVSVIALGECAGTVTTPLARLRPGDRRWHSFAWYAGRDVDHGPRFVEPYPDGTATVSVTWPYAGRGDRPSLSEEDIRPDPIVVRQRLRLAGDGPGSPSVAALIDLALADPTFRAWVDSLPDGVERFISVSRWPGPSFENPRWAPIAGRAPYGMTEISLTARGETRAVLIDTWTGELLAVVPAS